MGLFTNPLSHAGYPPGVTGTPSTLPSEVRAATAAEALAGVLNSVYISPATAGSGSTPAITAAINAAFASPPALGLGSTTPGPVAATTLVSTGTTSIGTGAGVATKVGNSTGTLGFFGGTGAVKGTQAALTNSVTASGTTGTIADFTSLTVYATDAAAIHGDIYQLALALSNVITVLRGYGMFT
jgi:hypothetical protein